MNKILTHEEIYRVIYKDEYFTQRDAGLSADMASRKANIRAVQETRKEFLKQLEKVREVDKCERCNGKEVILGNHYPAILDDIIPCPECAYTGKSPTPKKEPAKSELEELKEQNFELLAELIICKNREAVRKAALDRYLRESTDMSNYQTKWLHAEAKLADARVALRRAEGILLTMQSTVDYPHDIIQEVLDEIRKALTAE